MLSNANLRQLLEAGDCLDALKQGFPAEPATIRPQRLRTELPGPGTATALIPGLIHGIPASTAKVNAKLPCWTRQPSTAWRTGLSAALATDILARPGARDVAAIGAAAQSDLVLRGLARLRPLRRVLLYDLDASRAVDFAARHTTTSSDGCEVVDQLHTAVRHTEIIVCATWSRTALIEASDLAPGLHLTSLGAANPGKSNSRRRSCHAHGSSSTTSPSRLTQARWATQDSPHTTRPAVSPTS